MKRFVDEFRIIKDISKALNINIKPRVGYACLGDITTGGKVYVSCIDLKSSKYKNEFYGDKDKYYCEKGKFNDTDKDKSKDLFLLFVRSNKKYHYYGIYKLIKRDIYKDNYEERVYQLIGEEND